jgi:maltose alpha-D-glucosyltransferase/alpha-amylase
VLYYGDEIGMGDNVYLGDRNGVRTPMQWSADRNAGFSHANPQKLYLPVIIDPEYHYETVNVEAQNENPHSLLWWTRRLIALRKRYQAFGRGTMEFLSPENRKVLAFIRRYEDEKVLVVANLSRFVQGVTLDLSEFKGLSLVEMFGRIEMPGPIDGPYFLTLGPHSFYWFAIEPARIEAPASTWLDEEGEAPLLTFTGDVPELFEAGAQGALASHLPAFLRTRRWFAGKARNLRSAVIEESVMLRTGPSPVYLCFVSVQYAEGAPETYVLPLAYESGDAAFLRQTTQPDAVFLRVRSRRTGEQGLLLDAMYDEAFAESILRSIERGVHQKAPAGELVGVRTPALRHIGRPPQGSHPTVLRVEQSNTSVNYGDRLLLKLYRRVEPGINPDYEVGAYLTERGFAHSPAVGGAIEYKKRRKEPITLAVLSEFVHKEADAWDLTIDSLRDFFDRAAALPAEFEALPASVSVILRLTEEEPPPLVGETVGAFAEVARLLGQRTAELHVALATGPEGSSFVQESFTPYYQRSLYQSMRNLAANSFGLLAQRLKSETDVPAEAAAVLKLEDSVLARFRTIVHAPLTSMRIRTHGDYHLGQVLYTGSDFMITDFEGEPARSLNERRLTRSPLRDVAAMLRSFSYAMNTALIERQERGLPEEAHDRAKDWGRFWLVWVSSIFLGSYLEETRKAGLITAGTDEIELVLDVYMLEKAVYELGYELNNRPDWLHVPLQGILELLQVEA